MTRSLDGRLVEVVGAPAILGAPHIEARRGGSTDELTELMEWYRLEVTGWNVSILCLLNDDFVAGVLPQEHCMASSKIDWRPHGLD